VRVGIWLPWPVWIAIFVFGAPLYLVWACIAVAVFVIVSLVALAVTRDWRRSLRLGGLTFAAMIVPGAMLERHNAVVLARTVRGSA
jgi:hypothetical protein